MLKDTFPQLQRDPVACLKYVKINNGPLKAPRVIPVLWLSFVCERGVGEVGHLEVLLCPFPLGNKSCPVKWTKSK